MSTNWAVRARRASSARVSLSFALRRARESSGSCSSAGWGVESGCARRAASSACAAVFSCWRAWARSMAMAASRECRWSLSADVCASCWGFGGWTVRCGVVGGEIPGSEQLLCANLKARGPVGGHRRFRARRRSFAGSRACSTHQSRHFKAHILTLTVTHLFD